MLYLLRSCGFGKHSILKIGFSDDIERRMNSYFYSNPLTLVISIREGDMTLEYLIHRYLHSLGLQYCKSGLHLDEWFIDDPEVLRIFHLSRETLERLIWNNRDKVFNIKTGSSFDYSAFEYLFKKHIDSFEGTRHKVVNGKAVLTRAKSVDLDFWKFYMRNVEKEFTISENISQETSDFFNEFYSTGDFAKRMELFCEFMDTYKDHPEIADPVLEKVDPKFNDYYSLFGTEECRNLYYRETLLLSRMHEYSLKDEIRKRILKSFKVGERYTRKNVKIVMKDIFTSLKIDRIPKATELDTWFKIKKVLIISGQNKDHGFEILGIKKP